MDEKSMILEQERQEKQRKRNRYKKVKWIAGVLVAAVLVAGIWYVARGRELLAAGETQEVKIVTTSGQEVIYAKITAINGNEITYAVAEPVEVEESDAGEGAGGEMPEGGEMPDRGSIPEDGEMPDKGEMPEDGEMPDMGEMPEGMGEMPDMGEMPEGMGEMPDMGERGKGSSNAEENTNTATEMSTKNTTTADVQVMNVSMKEMSGEMPDMGSGMSGGGDMPDRSGGTPGGGGDMPDMDDMFGNGEMPDVSNMPGESGDMNDGRGNQGTVATDSNMFTYGDNVYQVGEETITAYIPVGTQVTTRLGTVTTFSRLSAGDYVALVVEEEGDEQIIMAVYIIG